jgi:hypothetical protein
VFLLNNFFGNMNNHFLGPNFVYLSFLGQDHISIRHKVACLLTNIHICMFGGSLISDCFDIDPLSYDTYLQLPPLPPQHYSS